MPTRSECRSTLLLICFAISSSLAHATVYTFTGNQNSRWALPGNWDPPTGKPGAGDKAIIPNGKTCLVDSDEAAEVVEIASGATLTIAGKTLLMQENIGTSQHLGIALDGTLRFEIAASERGVISYNGSFHITGSGTALADGGNGHGGLLENLSDTDTLTVSNGITLQGTLTLRIAKLVIESGGLLLVDDAADEMRIEDNGTQRDIEGGGTLRVSAGDLVLEREAVPNLNFTGRLEVLGGQMTLLGSGGDFGAVPIPNKAVVKLTNGQARRVSAP
ncbi:MAG: hypothetical protein CHACPFDD_03567 [Phycisphaerae bacterium]|nr:hypothetical protein [Phycisphaerae bacterium]